MVNTGSGYTGEAFRQRNDLGTTLVDTLFAKVKPVLKDSTTVDDSISFRAFYVIGDSIAIDDLLEISSQEYHRTTDDAVTVDDLLASKPKNLLQDSTTAVY